MVAVQKIVSIRAGTLNHDLFVVKGSYVTVVFGLEALCLLVTRMVTQIIL